MRQKARALFYGFVNQWGQIKSHGTCPGGKHKKYVVDF